MSPLRAGVSRLRCTRAMAQRLASIHTGHYRHDAWRSETERLLRNGWIERWEKSRKSPGLGGGQISTTLHGFKVTERGLAELRRRCAACFDTVPERPTRRSCPRRAGHWCQAVVDPYPEGII